MSTTPTTPTDPQPRTAPPSTDPFRALIDHHARWVFAAAYRQLHDTHLAEDATQTVFILLHQRSQRMQPTPKLKLSGWLFNTLQFTIKNLRREQRRRAAREREIAAQRTTSAPSTDTTTDLHDQLDTAVATLSDTDRTAILLRFYQDLPFDKIAATLRISEPAARKRVTRAIGALRKHLRLPPEESAAAGSLALAATHGLSHAPATLPTTLATTSAATSLPATTAATLKGVTTLMALAKLQAAAILAAATLLILIPATFIAVHHHAETTPIAAAPPASLPAAEDPNAPYVLPPGRVLINIPNPPTELHDQLAKPTQFVGTPNTRHLIIEATAKGDLRTSVWSANKLSAHQFVRDIAQLFPYQDFDPALSAASARWIFDGDLLYRANATPEQYVADIQTILRDNLHLSVTISSHDVSPKVILLHGQWKYTPDSSEPPSRGDFPDILLYDAPTPPLHPYGMKNWSNGATATEKSFPGQIAELIEQPVLLDIQGFPRYIGLKFDTPSQKMNRDALLQRISQQTGLTWTEEPRTLRQFSLTTPVADTRPLDDALETFTRLYALAPGQLLKHIPPIDLDLRQTLFTKYAHMGGPRNSFDVVYWRNNEVIGTGTLGYPTYPLGNLATQFFRIQFPQLESAIANTPLSGDFSYRAEKGITPDQYIAPFKQFLNDDFHLDPTIEFRDVPRKVLVLRGHWNYTPSPDLLPANFKNDNDGQPLPCIDFYSDPATATPHSLRSTVCSGGADTHRQHNRLVAPSRHLHRSHRTFPSISPRANPASKPTTPLPSSPPKTAPPSSNTSPSKPASPSPKKPAPSTTSSSNPPPGPPPPNKTGPANPEFHNS